MLLTIAILGGCLVMMGNRLVQNPFYYFRLEDQVPENHLLRLIDRHVSFDWVRAKLKDSYSETGRPSIDPELLLRILLIGYLYGITSERKLVEELRMHLAWRWFTGLGFDQEIPHHSTFSKNRHGRFHESNLFQQLFEQIVDRCLEAGLVQGEHLSVDGSFVQANASTASRIPREELAEAAQVKRTVREYLAELEQENATEEPVPQQERISTTDPDATYATKGGPAALGDYDNYLIDNHSCVIVGVQATAARLSQESAVMKSLAVTILLFIALSLGSLAAQDISDAEVVHPYLRVTVPNLGVVTATDTSSPAVAKAALAIVLSGSKVKCGPDSQLESVVEANAGSPLRTLASKISRVSCATNGRTLHVTATFTPNGAIQGDSLIASVIEGKPLLVEWKGALYVLYGVVYDEHLYPSGRHDNVIRKLLLIDPRYPDKRRLKAFVREKDSFATIEGVASVSVTER